MNCRHPLPPGGLAPVLRDRRSPGVTALLFPDLSCSVSPPLTRREPPPRSQVLRDSGLKAEFSPFPSQEYRALGNVRLLATLPREIQPPPLLEAPGPQQLGAQMPSPAPSPPTRWPRPRFSYLLQIPGVSSPHAQTRCPLWSVGAASQGAGVRPGAGQGNRLCRQMEALPFQVSVYFPARPWGWEPGGALLGRPRAGGSGAPCEGTPGLPGTLPTSSPLGGPTPYTHTHTQAPRPFLFSPLQVSKPSPTAGPSSRRRPSAATTGDRESP